MSDDKYMILGQELVKNPSFLEVESYPEEHRVALIENNLENIVTEHWIAINTRGKKEEVRFSFRVHEDTNKVFRDKEEYFRLNQVVPYYKRYINLPKRYIKENGVDINEL